MHGGAVSSPITTELACKHRFFVENDTQVECNSEQDIVQTE